MGVWSRMWVLKTYAFCKGQNSQKPTLFVGFFKIPWNCTTTSRVRRLPPNSKGDSLTCFKVGFTSAEFFNNLLAWSVIDAAPIFKDEFHCNATSFGCGYSLQKLPFQSGCNLFQEDMDEEAESGEGPGKPGFALLENRTFWQIPWKRFFGALYMVLLTLTNHQDLPIQRNRYSGIMGLQNWTCWKTNQQRGRPNKRVRCKASPSTGSRALPTSKTFKVEVTRSYLAGLLPIPLLRLMTLLCTQRTCASYILLIPIDIMYVY